uniref:CHASE3 domain-containing protein n=1 Tax=Roseihalotalea indica TaxID=2867963 RepID=A0AA49PZQ0_9BACT|nr:CHASE3 domain-containing protein [Tunicatimonas sp. TK19036]
MVVLLIIASASLNYYSRYLVIRHSDITKQIQVVRQGLKDMNRFVNLADLGLRGYIIKPEDSFLKPYHDAQDEYQANLDTLESYLLQQGYQNTQLITVSKTAINTYMQLLEEMAQLTEKQRMPEVMAIFEEDRGYAAWKVYSEFEKDVETFEDTIEKASVQSYQSAIRGVVIVQLLLLGIGVPILLHVIFRIRRDRLQRQQLFLQLDQSNRKYIFDDHENDETKGEETVIHDLTSSLEKAASFIKEIAQGNYTVDWEGLTADNQAYNQGNLAGELVLMREQMKQVKQADEQRLWTTEGEGKVAEISRTYQTDLTALGDHLIAYIVKYLKANQGGLFILNDEAEYDKHLSLIACYAYDKKKFEEKTIKVGQGLVGQAYLEQKTIRLKQIPENYVRITSGLGEATPGFLVIVPLKFNEEVLGVLEIASFHELASFEVDFLEQIGEIVASSVSIVRTNERTQELLAQAKEQTEEMRAQEEEMRQNMEEMQATQEQHERLQQELQENEKVLESKLEELEKARQQTEQIREAEKQRANEQIKSRTQMMEKATAKFKKREQELLEQLEAAQK